MRVLHAAFQQSYVLRHLLSGLFRHIVIVVHFHLVVMVVEAWCFDQRISLMIAALNIFLACFVVFIFWILGVTLFDLMGLRDWGSWMIGGGSWIVLSSFESVSVTSLL